MPNPKLARRGGKKKDKPSCKASDVDSQTSTQMKRATYENFVESDSGRLYRVCQCGLHILKKLGKTTSPWIAFSNHAGKDYKKCISRGYKNDLRSREKVNISSYVEEHHF